jgi:signal transduction histidine kinase
MRKILLKDFIKNAKMGGFIGIGISLTLTIVGGGLSIDPLFWIGCIIFGFLIGSLLSIGNELVLNMFFRTFPNYDKPLWPLLTIVYIVSVVIFYCFTVLVNHIFKLMSSGNIFYVSIGVGIACVMITVFSVYANEKEELLRLEKENKELAVVDERNRIARELHDSVSQNLFGISLNLNTLDYILEKDPTKAHEITKLLQEMVEEIQTEMRLMIYELRPVALSEKGFFEALESMVSLFRVRYNLDIHCDFNGYEGLDSHKQLVLYRVLQESLNNIVKHSGAAKVKVTLTVQNGAAELIIQDNGNGFITSDIDESEHFGLKGMKERIVELKGEFSLQSVVGQGTKVNVKFT